MRYRIGKLSVGLLLLLSLLFALLFNDKDAHTLRASPISPQGPNEIKLPSPRLKSNVSIEEAILKRRSIRNYSSEPISLDDLSQLLWAAQGITEPVNRYRAAPSAGATYPLEIYIAVGNVENLPPGVYKYVPLRHMLIQLSPKDIRTELSAAAYNQVWVRQAAAVLVFSADFNRTTSRYGKRGVRYVHIEVGHAAENVYLQTVSLDLATVAVGAFDDDKIKKILKLPKEEDPLYIMPIGKKAIQPTE